MLTPSPITKDEIAGAVLIRSRVKGIPPEFDTDFYLARWWRAYDGDLKAIERRMGELFQHRRVIGYDRIDTRLFDSKLEFARKTFERFSISPVHVDHHSGNMCVFVQRMAGTDLREIIKVLPLGYIIHSYYMLLDSFCRAVVAREAQTGGVSAVVTILDLEGLNFSDFVNPLSGPAKLARLVIKVWSDYFSEIQVKTYVINPPAILSVMWQVTKLLVDKKTLSRLTFLDKPSDLHDHISSKAIPECYGGSRRDDSGYAEHPETACREALRVTPQHHYDVNELWRRHGFEEMPAETSTASIKGKHSIEVKNFTVSGDVDFDVVKRKEGTVGDTVVWPKITLTTLKAPEQGSVICERGYEYRLRFTNPSATWLPLKVHYVVEFGKTVSVS